MLLLQTRLGERMTITSGIAGINPTERVAPASWLPDRRQAIAIGDGQM
jgi:hypothetical protein